MCIIKIPFLGLSEQGAALQRCVDRAVNESGLDAYGVVVALSHLLEAIADEVALGRAVSIPGFGLFAPVPMPERHRRMSRDPSPRSKPVFSPSRGFRQQVRFGAPPNEAEAKRLRQHAKNHADDSQNPSARVFTAMQAVRDQVAAQLGRTRS